MKTSEMHGKLIDALRKRRNAEVMSGLNPVSPGIDVPYEFGRRIGNRIGMDLMIEIAIKFFEGEEDKDDAL